MSSSAPKSAKSAGAETHASSPSQADSPSRGVALESPSTAHVRDLLNGPAARLPGDLRADMEARFGQDFSGVRLHTDARAARSARSLHATAYTVGSDIVFGAGAYAPRTAA